MKQFNIMMHVLKKLGLKPIFLLCRTRWIERNENLMIVDISEDLNSVLKRKGNENARMVIVAFEIPETKEGINNGDT